jgi:hypothetical protein
MPQISLQYSRDNPRLRFQQLVEHYRSMHRDGDPRRGVPAERMFDGKSLPRQANRINKLIARTNAKTILDYGSGKGTQYLPGKILENGVPRWNSMQEYWGVESIRCYDPGYQPFSVLPEGAFDGVICTDVLEHCPEEDLPWIVGELFGFARRFVFANVACYPAAKTLPNGENAHCTVRPVDFWRALFENAAAASTGVLWEVWAETRRDVARQELRVGNFEVIAEPAPAAASRIPLWRLV